MTNFEEIINSYDMDEMNELIDEVIYERVAENVPFEELATNLKESCAVIAYMHEFIESYDNDEFVEEYLPTAEYYVNAYYDFVDAACEENIEYIAEAYYKFYVEPFEDEIDTDIWEQIKDRICDKMFDGVDFYELADDQEEASVLCDIMNIIMDEEYEFNEYEEEAMPKYIDSFTKLVWAAAEKYTEGFAFETIYGTMSIAKKLA